jgi:hypothetical protein
LNYTVQLRESMYEICAIELCDFDILNGTLLHPEEDDAGQCCLSFDTECAKEVRVECVKRGFRSSVQVEDTQLRAREPIEPCEDALVLQNSAKSLVREVVEDEGKRLCSAFSEMLGANVVESLKERREDVADAVSATLLVYRNHDSETELWIILFRIRCLLPHTTTSIQRQNHREKGYNRNKLVLHIIH